MILQGHFNIFSKKFSKSIAKIIGVILQLRVQSGIRNLNVFHTAYLLTPHLHEISDRLRHYLVALFLCLVTQKHRIISIVLKLYLFHFISLKVIGNVKKIKFISKGDQGSTTIMKHNLRARHKTTLVHENWDPFPKTHIRPLACEVPFTDPSDLDAMTCLVVPFSLDKKLLVPSPFSGFLTVKT